MKFQPYENSGFPYSCENKTVFAYTELTYDNIHSNLVIIFNLQLE